MGTLIDTIKVKEVWIGLLISISVGIVLGYILKDFNMGLYYGTFASISASLFGFLITALSIMFVFPKKGRMKVLMKHRLYPTLFYGFVLAIIFQIFLFMFSLFGIFFDKVVIYQNIIYVTILSISLFFLFICIWILKMLIDLTFEKEKKFLRGKDINFQ